MRKKNINYLPPIIVVSIVTIEDCITQTSQRIIMGNDEGEITETWEEEIKTGSTTW